MDFRIELQKDTPIEFIAIIIVILDFHNYGFAGTVEKAITKLILITCKNRGYKEEITPFCANFVLVVKMSKV